MNRPETPVGAKIKAAEALLHCTDHLLAVYDAMPVVNAMGDYINGKYGNLPNFGSNSNYYGVQPPDTSSDLYFLIGF